MYEVIITSHAERELKRLDRSTKNRILPAALALADNPRPHGCLKVKAEERLWRIDSNNPKEKRMADIGVVQAILLLLRMLELGIEHYGWNDSASLVQNCVDSFCKYFEPPEAITPREQE